MCYQPSSLATGNLIDGNYHPAIPSIASSFFWAAREKILSHKIHLKTAWSLNYEIVLRAASTCKETLHPKGRWNPPAQLPFVSLENLTVEWISYSERSLFLLPRAEASRNAWHKSSLLGTRHSDPQGLMWTFGSTLEWWICSALLVRLTQGPPKVPALERHTASSWYSAGKLFGQQ